MIRTVDSSPPPPESADAVFEGFLLAREQGDRVNLDSLCARHPALADELRVLHAAWSDVDAALDRTTPSAAAPHSDALEARRAAFDRYTFGEELGRGGMGVVRSVWDEHLRRHLAMKTIRDLAIDAEARARARTRFLEEARITGRLEHPGIVPVHELGVDPDGRLYFTMQRVEGTDLAAIFERVNRGADDWTLVRALGVLLRACEAVAYAHDKGVVHRDLKPANVMVGRFGEAFVMDWGLARLKEAARLDPAPAGPSDESPLVTRDGDVLGTPAYMPPEQAAGDHEAVGPHSDVYAMGALLYHLLTGIPPFSDVAADEGADSVWTRARDEAPTPAGRLAPRQPPELIAICEKAMARRPERRYDSMIALARDLRAFLEDRVVEAHRTGPVVELRKWIARNRALAATLLAAVALAVAGSTTAAFVLARKNESIRVARETAERRTRAATEAQEFLVDLFRAIDPTESAEGHALTARELLDRGAATVDDEVSDVETRSRVLLWIGNAYASLGHPDAAVDVLRRALGVATDHEMTCAARSTLGGALDDLGRTEEGLRMLEAALVDAETHLGEEHASTANIRANLALIHYREGRLGEAERLNLRALEADAARGAAPHPRVLTNLAGVYLEQGRLDEAERAIERAVEAGRSSPVYGPRHIFTLEAVRALGECRLAAGRYEDAASTWAEILDPYVDALGWAHPALADFVPQLACLESELGRGEDGEEKLSRMAAALRERLGEEDVAVAWVEAHLGIVVERLGRLGEAERFYRRGLARIELEYGPHAPMSTSILHNLVRLLLDQDRVEEARPLAVRLRADLPREAPEFEEMRRRLDALLGPDE